MDIQFPMRCKLSRRGLLCVGILFVVGCSPPGPVLGTLAGRVTNNGKPVTGARIYFENAELGTGTVADLDAEGRFSVATADGPGLPLGKYRVAIKPQGISAALSPTGDLPLEALAGSSAAKDPPPSNSLIPADFYDFDNSGLAVEIKAGENPVWEIDLGK